MGIPDYQSLMKPVLEYLSKNPGPNRIQDIIEKLSDGLQLSEEERNSLLPSGRQTIISNRIGWARTYLKKAGLLEYPKRGYSQITEIGKKVINQNPSSIDNHYLNQFDDFVEFRNRTSEKESDETESTNESLNNSLAPDEQIAKGMNLINAALAEDLLEKIENNSPAFFESLVLDLLSSMGYGDGEVTGRSGDGGIDGFISQDALGIEKIYFQAKRFTGDTRVSASMVRDFVGSLDLRGVSKGVFITSSDFPKDTEQKLSGTHKSIVLINQKRLLDLMIKYNIGVSVEKVVEIKKIDTDYFPED